MIFGDFIQRGCGAQHCLDAPHLAVTDADLRGQFVCARDLGAPNTELRVLYPGVPAYRYRPGRYIPLDFARLPLGGYPRDAWNKGILEFGRAGTPGAGLDHARWINSSCQDSDDVNA